MFGRLLFDEELIEDKSEIGEVDIDDATDGVGDTEFGRLLRGVTGVLMPAS